MTQAAEYPDFTEPDDTSDTIVARVRTYLGNTERDPIEARAVMLRACGAIADRERERAQRVLAALGDIAPEAKPARAPRKPRAARAETMPEQQEAYVFESLKIKSPQTLAEVATMAGVTRSQAQIAIDSLLTDGRVSRERAGKGWRYSHAPLDVESMRTLETR